MDKKKKRMLFLIIVLLIGNIFIWRTVFKLEHCVDEMQKHLDWINGDKLKEEF